MFNPEDQSAKAREDHLYDDLDAAPDAHHHTIGQGPNQATSLPLAQQLFDRRYSTLNHSHPELAGDNLIVNGDAASGDAYWLRTHVNASTSISANRFITTLPVNPSSAIWKSEAFVPVVNEECTGSITYQATQTTVTIQVDILWNTTGALPDDGDGISTTETLLSTTVDAVSLGEVSTLAWTVPATCAAARLFVRIGQGSVASGFPVTVIHDNVQLISKLRDVSPLYVGVTDPQTMEGPLTITSPLPLVMPDGAVEGYVWTSGPGGEGSWQDGTDPVEFSADWTKPAGVGTGELWVNEGRMQDTPLFVVFNGSGSDKLITGVSPTYAWIQDAGSYYLTLPTDGVLEITAQLWVGWPTAPAYTSYSLGALDYVVDSGTATVDASAQDYWFSTVWGGNTSGTFPTGRFNKETLTRNIQVSAVGVDGVTLRFRWTAYYSGVQAAIRYERLYCKFFPNAALRTVNT